MIVISAQKGGFGQTLSQGEGKRKWENQTKNTYVGEERLRLTTLF